MKPSQPCLFDSVACLEAAMRERPQTVIELRRTLRLARVRPLLHELHRAGRARPIASRGHHLLWSLSCHTRRTK